MAELYLLNHIFPPSVVSTYPGAAGLLYRLVEPGHGDVGAGHLRHHPAVLSHPHLEARDLAVSRLDSTSTIKANNLATTASSLFRLSS